MDRPNSMIAVFDEHVAAAAAVTELSTSGYEIKNLSIFGKGYRTEEKLAGFYSEGSQIRFCGSRGASWGALWSLFGGGALITIPLAGHVMVLGFVAGRVICAIEDIVVVSGLSVLGAALFSVGIPKDSIAEYETALKADGCLVLARGTPADMTRAKDIMNAAGASRADTHASMAARALA